MKTEHGYEVVESFKIDHGHLVRVERSGHLHNHVTWIMGDGGRCSSGCYFSTREEAVRSFEARKEALR